MNASEIEYIETRMQAGLRTLPSPEQLELFVAKVHTERNRHLAVGLAHLMAGLGNLVVTVRKIAEACTAARLYARNV